jgi:transcriptional regulator
MSATVITRAINNYKKIRTVADYLVTTDKNLNIIMTGATPRIIKTKNTWEVVYARN